MAAHFGLRTSAASGVDGERQLHEGVSAVTEGVTLTGLNPRELKHKEIQVSETAEEPKEQLLIQENNLLHNDERSTKCALN